MRSIIRFFRGLFAHPVIFDPATSLPKDDGIRRRAVIFGLEYVDPRKYKGWNGYCPGTLADANRVYKRIRARGYEAVALLDSQATIYGVIRACEQACADMVAGDRLVIYGSSHGGQVKDYDYDEPSGMDSTTCLWDGQLVDDEVWKLLRKVPAGVEVDFITDSCNSGTNYRGAETFAPSLVEHETQARGRAAPSLVCAFTHFGGCEDGKSSYGGRNGGVFTNTLLATGPDDLTRAEWFVAASRMAPRNQKFVYEALGPSVQDGKAWA